MRKLLQIAAALGLASCLLVPSVSDARQKAPKECRLNSQEFVLFEMDISQKIISLQDDVISSNINDAKVKSALTALIDANNNLYNDVGRRASQSDKFVYTPEKLDALNNAANDYYSTVYYLLRNRNSHLMDAYRIAQATKMAADEFKGQCENSKKRSKNWYEKWDNINRDSNYREPVPRAGFVMPGQPAPAAAHNPNGWDNHPGPNGSHGPNARGRRAMDDASFNSLSSSVSKAYLDNDRKVTIQSAISSGNYLSCDQMAVLVKSFSFDEAKNEIIASMADASAGGCTSDQVAAILKLFMVDTYKVKAAVKLYDIVTDRNNWFKVYDVFSFGNSRKEVEDQIRNK